MLSKLVSLVVLVLARVCIIQVVDCALIFLPTNITFVNVGDSITLACHITPLTARVAFEKNGILVGECTVPIPGLVPGACTPAAIVQNILTENTTWTFNNLDFPRVDGLWRCIHNTESETIQINVTETASVLYTNEATLPPTIEKNTMFEVKVNCSYPKPDIKWTLQTCSGSSNSTNVQNKPTVVENPNTCVPPRKEYSSTIKVSDMASPKERTCYKVQATLSYSFNSSISISKLFSTHIYIDGPATTTLHQTTKQLQTDDTTFNITEIVTTNTERPTTDSSWLSVNKYYVGAACGGVVVFSLLLIIGLCCIHQKRRKANHSSSNKSHFEVHTSSSLPYSSRDNSRSDFKTNNDLVKDNRLPCTSKGTNTCTSDHL